MPRIKKIIRQEIKNYVNALFHIVKGGDMNSLLTMIIISNRIYFSREMWERLLQFQNSSVD